jgi:DHA1 family tetracycline resistance protein-like MFS transporter
MTFSWRRANPFGAMVLLRSHRELFGLAAVTFLLHFAHHVFSSVYVLYAGYRYGWTAWEVGFLLSFAGGLDMIVQGTLITPIVKRFGDRATMVVGLFGGAVGIACMGWAPTGLAFALALVPNAMWGLSMPTSQSLMTQRVSESEQGQLQGANMSVASIAGVISPLVMGTLYGMSVGEAPVLPHPGTVFFISAGVLLTAACIGWSVARRAGRDDAAAR